jgi:ribosome recycling factor
MDILKAKEKDHSMSEDENVRAADQVQKETDKHIAEIDQLLTQKEKEIMTV